MLDQYSFIERFKEIELDNKKYIIRKLKIGERMEFALNFDAYQKFNYMEKSDQLYAELKTGKYRRDFRKRMTGNQKEKNELISEILKQSLYKKSSVKPDHREKLVNEIVKYNFPETGKEEKTKKTEKNENWFYEIMVDSMLYLGMSKEQFLNLYPGELECIWTAFNKVYPEKIKTETIICFQEQVKNNYFDVLFNMIHPSEKGIKSYEDFKNALKGEIKKKEPKKMNKEAIERLKNLQRRSAHGIK